MEGFEVAIAALLEKMSICEFYTRIYSGVSLPSSSTANSLQPQDMLDSALPELYAAVLVFAVKASTYFNARSMYIICEYKMSLHYAKQRLGSEKFAITMNPFDIEFQSFIDEINAKEGTIRECADAATMEGIRSMILHIVFDTIG